MPSGKKAKQQRRAAAAPPVRAKGSGSRFSRPTLIVTGVVLLVLIGLGLGLPLALSSNGGSGGGSPTTSADVAPLSTLGHLVAAPPLGSPGLEGPPLESGPNLAPAAAPSADGTVDGISCQGSEQVAFHIHARLTIFVDGHPVRVPYGIGIADPQAQLYSGTAFVTSGACFSWLHTHAADGIIHIESPVGRVYTLGNFFDVWGQPLSRTQVGPAKGHVTAFFDGKVWLGNPRVIPLNAHSQIQLDVGRPLVTPVRITNWGNL
jgi:hypothetical protein